MTKTNQPSFLTGGSDNYKQGKKRELGLVKRLGGISYIAVFACVAFVAPVPVFASVQITEIMYDIPGGDSGHEWVEVTNTGPQSVDLSTYRFSEGGTNHKITAVSGDSTLSVSTSAVLVADATKFAGDWPSYTGSIFKSAFSLSNTGEVLAIKNASSTDDTVSYTSAMGASGDGGSLHRSGSTFIAALPNPGMFPGEIHAVQKTTPPAAVKNVIKKSTTRTPDTLLGTGTPVMALAETNNAVQPQSHIIPALEWVLGLAALLLVGVATLFAARSENVVHVHETKTPEDEFEIVE